MRNDVRFFIQPVPCARGYDVYLMHNGAWANGDITMVQVREGDIPPVALRLTEQQAQDLADQLWRAGIRPTEGTGSAGSLAATERHLADMRNLVFSHFFTGEKP